MNFVDEDALLYTRILIHGRLYLGDICIKDSNPGYIASVRDRTHNRQQSIGPLFEVPSPVLPNDPFDSFFIC